MTEPTLRQRIRDVLGEAPSMTEDETIESRTVDAATTKRIMDGANEEFRKWRREHSDRPPSSDFLNRSMNR